MKWCLTVLSVSVTCFCAVEIVSSQPQPQSAGGVPLPTAPGLAQHTHQGHGLASPAGPHFNHQQGGGVPLPLTPGQAQHHPQSHGVSLSSATAQNPAVSAGAPLPSLGPHSVVVVPLDQTGGVPLPPHSISGGHGSPPISVGVPLPPHKGAGGIGAAGIPTLIEGMATLKPVRNLDVDSDVQLAVGLTSVNHHLQLRTKADHAVKITGVISAHKQIVSGQVLYLTLRVRETKCPIGVPDPEKCPLDLSEDEHICEVALWQRPWLNSSKIINEKTRCAEAEDDNDFKRWGPQVLLHVPSPAETDALALPQGVEEQQVGVEAFNYIDHGSESKFRGELIAYDVTSMKFDPLTDTTQVQVDVEYGFTLCLKSHDQLTDTRECPPDIHRGHYICSVVVVHNPNQITSLEVVPILDDDDDIHCERKNAEEELVVPVVAPCSGCPHPAPLNDPTILEVADFALREYDRTSTDEDNLHILLRLIKAHSQVVAGIRYFLTVELAESLCKKTLTGVDVNRTFCGQDHTEETEICDLHVIDQPWIPARDLINARCYDRDSYPSSSHDEFIVPVSLGAGLGASHRDSSSLPGNEGHLNVAEDSSGAVKFVVEEYNRREDDDEYYKLVKVHEVTSQVQGQDGRRYHIVAELGETRCRKSNPSTGDHCPLDPTEEHEVCEADVLEQPLTGNHHPYRILSLRCDDLDDYLFKKFMPRLSPSDVMDHPFLDVAADTSAGYHSVATNDSLVHQAAIFVANQFNLRKDEDELFILGRVTSSLLQSSPSGVTYHLEVELAETHCKKYLFVADPERCPIDHSEEREVCQAEVLISQAPATDMQLIKLFCDEINDYYTRRLRDGPGGDWMDVNVDDQALAKLGRLIANEYDFRSDEDSLFIFHKVLKARKQIASGIKYQLVVELLETVCPKYKRRINKARCAPDIGEDHMVCEAHVLSQPWLQRDDISHLRCAEKDEFFAGDESVEVFYPKVHPSAHARPVFKSHFLLRTSDESEESNERFYSPSGHTNIHHSDTDEYDSDERQRTRGRRAVLGSPSSTALPNSFVKELASFAVQSLDHNSSDIYSSGVKEVLHAEMQETSGNLMLEILVHSTTCLKNQQDLSVCQEDPHKPVYLCKVTITEDPPLGGYVVSSMSCHARNTNPKS